MQSVLLSCLHAVFVSQWQCNVSVILCLAVQHNDMLLLNQHVVVSVRAYMLLSCQPVTCEDIHMLKCSCWGDRAYNELTTCLRVYIFFRMRFLFTATWSFNSIPFHPRLCHALQSWNPFSSSHFQSQDARSFHEPAFFAYLFSGSLILSITWSTMCKFWYWGT